MLRPAPLLAGLLACTPGDAPKADPPKTDPPKTDAPRTDAPTPACTARVAEIRALLAQLDTDPVVINTSPGMQLAESSRGGAIDDGVPLFIREDGSFEFDAQPLPTLAALKVALDEEYDKAKLLSERMGRPWQPRLILVADARTPVATLRDLAAVVAPATTFALIVNLAGDTIPTPPPIPDAVRDAMVVRADERSQKLASVIIPAIGTCTPVTEVFDAVASTSADMRGKLLHENLPDAIAKCRCEGLDVETLVAAVWSMSAKTEPAKRQLLLPLTTDRKAGALELPASARVRDLVPLLEARDAPFRLVLKK